MAPSPAGMRTVAAPMPSNDRAAHAADHQAHRTGDHGAAQRAADRALGCVADRGGLAGGQKAGRETAPTNEVFQRIVLNIEPSPDQTLIMWAAAKCPMLDAFILAPESSSAFPSPRA